MESMNTHSEKQKARRKRVTERLNTLLLLQTAILIALYIAGKLELNAQVCRLIGIIGMATLITAAIQQSRILWRRNRDANKEGLTGYRDSLISMQALLASIVIMNACSHYTTIEILRNL